MVTLCVVILSPSKDMCGKAIRTMLRRAQHDTPLDTLAPLSPKQFLFFLKCFLRSIVSTFKGEIN